MKLPKKIAGGKIIKVEGKVRRVKTQLGWALVMDNVTVQLEKEEQRDKKNKSTSTPFSKGRGRAHRKPQVRRRATRVQRRG